MEVEVMTEHQDYEEKGVTSKSYGLNWGSMGISVKTIIISVVVANLCFMAGAFTYWWLETVWTKLFGA